MAAFSLKVYCLSVYVDVLREALSKVLRGPITAGLLRLCLSAGY